MQSSLNAAKILQQLHWEPAKSDWLFNFRNCDNAVEDLAADGTSGSIVVLLYITCLSLNQLAKESISKDVTDAWEKEGEHGRWKFTERNTNFAETGDMWKYTTWNDGVDVKNNAEGGSSGLEENGNLLWSVEVAGI